MPDIELSTHARAMLVERDIPEEWVWRTIQTPNRKRRGDDDNLHYTKTIKERGGRVLQVIVNPNVQPNRIVTVFFDRRLGKKQRERK